MGQKCPICSSINKLDIEKQYLQGISIAKLAKDYNVSYHSLYEHCKSHISRQLLQSWKKKDAMQSLNLMDEFGTLIQGVKQMIEDFKSGKKHGLTLKAIDTLIRLYGVMCQFASVFYQSQADDQVNNREVIEQEIEEQQTAEIHEHLKNLNEIEYYIYKHLNMSMLSPGGYTFIPKDCTPAELFEIIKGCFPDDCKFTDEKLPDGKPVFKRTKFKKDIDTHSEPDSSLGNVTASQNSDKEQEKETKAMRPGVIEPTIIPGGGRRTKLDRHLLSRRIEHGRKVDDNRGGGVSIPFSRQEPDASPFDREYAPDE